MEFYTIEMVLAILVVACVAMHWCASMVGNGEPVSNDNRDLVEVDPLAPLLPSTESSSASMVEDPEPTLDKIQESVEVDRTASLHSSSASMVETTEPIPEEIQELSVVGPPAALLPSASESSSASMVETTEALPEQNQESVDINHSAFLLSSPAESLSLSMVMPEPSRSLLSSAASSSSAPMVENPEPVSKVTNPELEELDPCASLLSSAPLRGYDVFLSFRGTDTRTGIVSHLYNELQDVRGIQTFKDDRDLELGACISPSLLKAIKESDFAVVVLSKNYAQSAWCLEELTNICKCMSNNKNRIIPLFYHVEPTDVRYQKSSFEEAFKDHERKGRYSPDQMQQWKKALETVADFSGTGYNAKDHKTERKVIEVIAESLCRRVRPIEFKFNISPGDFEQFKATRKAMDDVIEALKDGNVTAVGVDGMGGIGKTAMVEQVGIEAQHRGLFRHVIMAVIPKPKEQEELEERKWWGVQRDLAVMLRLELPGDGEIARARTLRQRILSLDRILIILDNVWDEIDLTRIGIPDYEQLKRHNSKVLLTTRRLVVCRLMNCDERIPLNPLDEDDSLKLFEKSFQTPICKFGVEIAKECSGLPISLTAVAKALRGKRPDQLEEAAELLKESNPPVLEGDERVFKCIKLSYDYLKSPHSRSCFLLCCLFPENHDIHIEDLLKYQNYNSGADNTRRARATIRSAVEALKDSSLLLDGKTEGSVKMHDVIRDVAVRISKDRPRYFVKAGRELKTWPRLDDYGCCTAISLMKNKICKLPDHLVCSELHLVCSELHSVCSKLHILLLQSNSYSEIPESFLETQKALRVLDLSLTGISLLPSSFNYLISLHTLCLNGCVSMTSGISLLGSLKKLKILSMREIRLAKLPEEIGDLTELRMLDFTSESVDMVPSNVICKLSELEELYMQCNYMDWGRNGEGTEALFDELTSLLDLHILKVFISDPKCLPEKVKVEPRWRNFDICIGRDLSFRDLPLDSSPSPDSKALTLDTTMGTLPEWFIHVVTKKTEKLKYRNCRGLRNLLEEYYQEDYEETLHALKYLHVIGPSENVKQLMIPIKNEPVFENLEELHLVEMKCLEELCVGELPSGSLCRLRLLEVRGCHVLMDALLQSNLLKRLQKLEKLICEDMDGLEYVFSSEGSVVEQSTLAELIEMRLENLGSLRKIWNGPAPLQIFCHVKLLVVFECNEMKNLFTSDIAHRLHELEDLRVENCRRLVRVIEASVEKVHEKMIFPKLKKLFLETLLKLTRFYGSTRSATDDEENIEFPLLELPHVERCKNFNSPARDMLDSMKNKQPVLIPMQETGQRETQSFPRRRGVRM